MALTEYNPNDFLNSLGSSNSGVTEYNPDDFLGSLKPYSEQAQVAKPSSNQPSFLKGAEFFARNPIAPNLIPESIKEPLIGAGEAATSMISGAVATPIGAITGILTNIFSDKYGTQEGIKLAEKTAGDIIKTLTYEPKSEKGKEYTQLLSELPAKLSGSTMGAPVPEVWNAAPLVKPAISQLTSEGKALVSKVAVPEAIKNTYNKYTNALEPTLQDQFMTRQAAGNAPMPKASVEVSQPSAPVVERAFNVPAEQPVNMAETQPFVPEQIGQREALLKKIGLEDIRLSALEGNPKEAASQLITSQADQGPYGSGMTHQINTEKAVLDRHFEKVQEQAGGTVIRHGTSFQEGDKIKVGKTIKDALQEGYDEHQAETKTLYADAAKIHGNTPVNVNKFNDFLNSDENFAYQNEKGLQTGVKQFMTRKGFLDENGNARPLTVAQAEEVRQYINSKYHYETKQLGGQLKGLIDQDVFEQVGGETYEKARKHYQKGIQVYDDPKALGDLLGDQGVNQKIPDEKVASKVVTLPNTQFEHLFNTLESDGKTIATNQIKTSLVEQIRQAGQSAKDQPFNSVAAAKEAANLSEKLKIAFKNDLEGLNAIYDGIEAGNILHIPSRYQGAGVQTHLLKNKFSEMAVQKAGTAIGGATGGIFGPVTGAAGALIGEKVGAEGAAKLRSGRQTKQLQKEIKSSTPISEMGEKFKIKD